MNERLRGAEYTAIWIDERATIDGAKVRRYLYNKEKESRVKQIDFAKPLRKVGVSLGADKSPDVEVLKEGLTLIRNGMCHHIVDENGKIEAFLAEPGDGFMWFENVPEEPKEYLGLWFRASSRWEADSVIMTKTEADEWVKNGPAYQKRQAVKVPV